MESDPEAVQVPDNLTETMSDVSNGNPSLVSCSGIQDLLAKLDEKLEGKLDAHLFGADGDEDHDVVVNTV